MESPTALGIVGGVIGASLGMAVSRRSRRHVRDVYSEMQQQRRETGGYEHGESHLEATYPPMGPSEYYREGKGAELGDTESDSRARAEGLRGKAQGKAEDVRESLSEKAEGLREKAAGTRRELRERAENLRERMPSRHEARERARGAYDRAFQDRPLMIALGTIALGAAAAFLLPATRRERERYQPARERARATVRAARERVEERISTKAEQREAEAGESGYAPSTEPRIINPNEERTPPGGPVLH